MPDEQWYYASQGRQLGPVTREMLRHLIVTAQVRETDLVWTPGMAQWVSAQMAPQLMTAPTPAQQGYAETRFYVEFAGFWRRLLAWAIDMVVLGVLSIITGLIVLVALGGYNATLDGPTLAQRPTFTMEIALAVAIAAVHWLYYALMESSAYQATLGKLAMGIFVTDESGMEISFAQASGRFLAKALSAAILMIGFLMAGWTQRKQALHDLAAGTLVVRKR